MKAARVLSETWTLMQGLISLSYSGRRFASMSEHCCGVNCWPGFTGPFVSP